VIFIIKKTIIDIQTQAQIAYLSNYFRHHYCIIFAIRIVVDVILSAMQVNYYH
jgi:hypothetical protein